MRCIEIKTKNEVNTPACCQTKADPLLYAAGLQIQDMQLSIENYKKTNQALETQIHDLKNSQTVQVLATEIQSSTGISPLHQEANNNTKQIETLLNQEKQKLDILSKNLTQSEIENKGLKTAYLLLQKAKNNPASLDQDEKLALKAIAGENVATLLTTKNPENIQQFTNKETTQSTVENTPTSPVSTQSTIINESLNREQAQPVQNTDNSASQSIETTKDITKTETQNRPEKEENSQIEQKTVAQNPKDTHNLEVNNSEEKNTTQPATKMTETTTTTKTNDLEYENKGLRVANSLLLKAAKDPQTLDADEIAAYEAITGKKLESNTIQTTQETVETHISSNQNAEISALKTEVGEIKTQLQKLTAENQILIQQLQAAAKLNSILLKASVDRDSLTAEEQTIYSAMLKNAGLEQKPQTPSTSTLVPSTPQPIEHQSTQTTTRNSNEYPTPQITNQTTTVSQSEPVPDRFRVDNFAYRTYNDRLEQPAPTVEVTTTTTTSESIDNSFLGRLSPEGKNIFTWAAGALLAAGASAAILPTAAAAIPLAVKAGVSAFLNERTNNAVQKSESMRDQKTLRGMMSGIAFGALGYLAYVLAGEAMDWWDSPETDTTTPPVAGPSGVPSSSPDWGDNTPLTGMPLPVGQDELAFPGFQARIEPGEGFYGWADRHDISANQYIGADKQIQLFDENGKHIGYQSMIDFDHDGVIELKNEQGQKEVLRFDTNGNPMSRAMHPYEYYGVPTPTSEITTTNTQNTQPLAPAAPEPANTTPALVENKPAETEVENNNNVVIQPNEPDTTTSTEIQAPIQQQEPIQTVSTLQSINNIEGDELALEGYQNTVEAGHGILNWLGEQGNWITTPDGQRIHEKLNISDTDLRNGNITFQIYDQNGQLLGTETPKHDGMQWLPSGQTRKNADNRAFVLSPGQYYSYTPQP